MRVLEFLYTVDKFITRGVTTNLVLTERTSEHELDKFKSQRLKGRNNKSGLTENSKEQESMNFHLNAPENRNFIEVFIFFFLKKNLPRFIHILLT